MLYLDVWERHITHIEDENENRLGIREVALRGPDTATRAQVVWQMRLRELTTQELSGANTPARLAALADEKLKPLREPLRPSLRARTNPQQRDDNPCLILPASRYRGAENQLYRVEIHRGGKAWSGSGSKDEAATFKWSRENGSVVFPITNVAEDIVTLENLGRDNRFGLCVDDWVEIEDDDYILQNRAEPLLQIKKIDTENSQVTLKALPAASLGRNAAKHPLLRRWDHKGEVYKGAALVIEGALNADNSWLTLEDGVQILFSVPNNGAHSYISGDYWLIPARAATGGLEWPGPDNEPLALPPHGVVHHYAPLAVISVDANGGITAPPNGGLRRRLKQLWE
jgi:hypothetical protein